MLIAYSINLRLPSRYMAKNMQDWRLHPIPFALTDQTENIIHSGLASVISLAEQFTKVKKVNLFMAASDVTVLSLPVPPMSAEKIKLALPALVEDSIIGDTSACHIVASPEIKGLRRVAVIDRAWLTTVISALQKEGAKVFHAYPAQLCLPLREKFVSASVMEIDDLGELSLRKPNNEAIGISLRTDKNSQSREENICRTLCLLTPHENCELMVESSRVEVYAAAANQLAQNIDNPHKEKINKLHIITDDWKIYLEQSKKIDLDLMTGLANSLHQQRSSKLWKLPLALAASLIVFNVIALHTDWWRMRQERNQLITNLDNVYKKNFTQPAKPKTQLENLEGKLRVLGQKKGGNVPEDFLSLLANTTVALKHIHSENINTASRPSTTSSVNTVAHAITKLEYRNHALKISLKSDMAPNDELATSRLAENHLTLQRIENSIPSQPGIVIWNVQSSR